VLLKRDPVDEDVPYCTLKSFPAVIDHCIEWARDKVYAHNDLEDPLLFQSPSVYTLLFISSNFGTN